MTVEDMCRGAKAASLKLAGLDGDTKNRAIAAIADALQANVEAIAVANKKDLEAATGLAQPVLKRLKYDASKVAASVEGLRSLEGLADPVGTTLAATELDKGLDLYRVSCPIGVIGVVFESRPDALVQISTLCLKSGNAVLMKGGSEALNTNRILARIVHDASVAVGAPEGWIQLMESRSDVSEMLKQDDCIDLVIPRGSNAFVKYIMENTDIPVMGHADGICHVYVDDAADIGMAVRIAVDSKTQYVSVCNAMETLLVHRDIAAAFLPEVASALRAKGVRLLGCETTRGIIEAEPATEADWDTEYLDYVLSIKVVSSLDEAIAHINEHGSGHTDAIVTANPAHASRFTSLVDSADVFWNCSTRFADGFRFGLGAEVGISTGKIHARGPVGLEGLCTYKWILKGSGDTVADFADGERHFTHRRIDGDVRDIFK
ncbi:MAG: glutamate-5-semialdehyde dehydrogenase [Victivallales bacterium]|nr:glutamate-5-semialdehyde dehydrogenase [Victivallales bacterium]